LGLEFISSGRKEAGKAFFEEGAEAHEAGADYCGVGFDVRPDDYVYIVPYYICD